MTPEEKKERKRLYDIEYRKRKAQEIKEKQANYRKENSDKIKTTQKVYTEKVKEKKKEYDAEYRAKNLELKKQRDKKYYQKNKNKILDRTKKYRSGNRDKINNYHKNRRQTDPVYRLSNNIRVYIRNSFKRKGLNKMSKTEIILGCTFGAFKQYLESKFEPWMNWDNYGLYNGQPNYGWDIDHIIPLVTAKNEDDVLKLNYHTNLQPLCSHVNRDIKKGII